MRKRHNDDACPVLILFTMMDVYVQRGNRGFVALTFLHYTFLSLLIISPELLTAYQRTRYHVPGLSLDIRIKQHTPSLDFLLKQQGAARWTFLTACNPFSQVVSEEENAVRHQQLEKQLTGYLYFEGEGIGEDQSWKPEKSFLVVGMNKEESIRLGELFEQNAIVYGEYGQPAKLLLLRH